MTLPKAPAVVERIRAQGDRVHLPLGGACNNNCLFCMEEDRASRARAAQRLTPEAVRWAITQHRGAEELCLTSGEPTTREDLPQIVRLAKELGFARLSLMTNGRRLAYAPYAQALFRAGLTRVYVSVQGDSPGLHDGLTRTPGSFEQTVAGLRNIARFCPTGIELHTSTVLTRRNVARQAEIYAFLRSLGVGQVVFNALQITGRAVTNFAQVVPRYREVIEGFLRVATHTQDSGVAAFLVDVPLCLTDRLPDRNRGYVERHVHYEASRALQQDQERSPELLREVTTAELDSAFRCYGDPCKGCYLRDTCPGVYRAYAERFGWDEFGLTSLR